MYSVQRRTLIYTVVLLALLGIASLACGGGGGDSEPAEPQPVLTALPTDEATPTRPALVRSPTRRPVATFAAPTATLAPTPSPPPGTEGTSWQIAAIVGEGGDYLGLTFSPDGTRLAIASRDEFVRLMDPVTGKVVRTLVGHTAPVNQVVFAPDGSYLLSAADDGTILRWDPNTGAQLTVLGDSVYGKVGQLAISPDGSLVISSSGVGSINVWNAGDGEFMIKYIGGYSPISGLGFSPGGFQFASSSLDGSIIIFPIDGSDGRVLAADPDPVQDAIYTDGNHVASANKTGVWLWDLISEQVLVLEPVPEVGAVDQLAVSHDGALLAALSHNGTIWVWELATLELQTAIPSFGEELFAIAFSPICDACPSDPGWMLASSGKEGKIWLWGIQEQPTE